MFNLILDGQLELQKCFRTGPSRPYFARLRLYRSFDPVVKTMNRIP